MSRRDDDLSPFRDDPVFRALTGPATEAELAGEAEALAAFRTAKPSRPVRRFVARIGTGGAVAIATLALSGGVAAAYSGELPAPLQHFAHDIAAPLAVPDTAKPTSKAHPSGGSHHKPGLSAGAAPSAVPSSSVAGNATTSPSPHATTTTLSGGVTPSPVVTPTTAVVVTTPTPTPTPTPSRTPLLKGASLGITASETRVTAGASLTVTGQLDAADSTPIVGRQVALRERQIGVPGWTKLGVQTTSSSGAVVFAVPDIEHNVRLMFHIGRHVHSSIVRVVVIPTIVATPTASEANPSQETITVTVTGGQVGDVVGLDWFAEKKQHRHAALDATGTAIFTVLVPKHRTVTYHVFLRRTKEHAAAPPATFALSPAPVTPHG